MTRTMATDYTTRELCETFGVSRSGYYARRNGGQPSEWGNRPTVGHRKADPHKR